jgi:hypothetical protein
MPLHHSLLALTNLHLTARTVSPHMNAGCHFWVLGRTELNWLIPQTDSGHKFHTLLFKCSHSGTFQPAVWTVRFKNSLEDWGGGIKKLWEGGVCCWHVAHTTILSSSHFSLSSVQDLVGCVSYFLHLSYISSLSNLTVLGN